MQQLVELNVSIDYSIVYFIMHSTMYEIVSLVNLEMHNEGFNGILIIHLLHFGNSIVFNRLLQVPPSLRKD